MVKKTFPPQKLKDLSKQSISNIFALTKTIRNSQYNLVLGAGVSMSAGLPSWKTLIDRMSSSFFENWVFGTKHGQYKVDIPPREMSIAFTPDMADSDETLALVQKLSEQEILLVTQQIKNCIRDKDWVWLLRRALYDYDTRSSSELIKAIVDLCSCHHNKILSIVNYNYDDLLENELKNNKIDFTISTEWAEYNKGNRLIIYHPHGFLPLDGGPAQTNFTLSEEDYHVDVHNPFSWANLISLKSYLSYPCIFIGSSLVDPAIRRILRISKNISRHSHYAFLPVNVPVNKQNMMLEALTDNDLLKLGIKVIRYDPNFDSQRPHSRLIELIYMLNKGKDDESIFWE